ALPNPGPSPTSGPRGNGGATDVGVTAETIKVGGLFFNGSWLDKYSQVAEQAASAYFRYVNDRGGIHGRKIEFSGCDTAATVNGTQGCLRKLTEQNKVFSLGPSLDFNLDTAVPYLADKKVPFIGTPGLYDAEFDSPYMFSSQYRGGEMGAIAATFMVQRQGAKRIAVSWNTQPPGPPCFDGVKRVAKALGVEIVVDASNGPTESDLSPQVIRTRSANPDSIIFCNDPVNAVKFVQAAGRQNYEPPAGWIGAFCLADDVPQAMGPAGVGFFCLSSYDPYWGNSPGIVEMNQITRYYFPSHFHHAYTMPVFAGAKILVEALRRVGPELTRDKLLATMRTMDAFDTRMGITFNFASRVAQKASGIVAQADENLRWKLVTDRFAVAG
ncbi:MAG: ABC transporter substrate-binding protein, partial [Actinomycetota bacterium]|nr:ABC transporter substrate-binding protein [Actinomycetota bacterium]